MLKEYRAATLDRDTSLVAIARRDIRSLKTSSRWPTTNAVAMVVEKVKAHHGPRGRVLVTWCHLAVNAHCAVSKRVKSMGGGR